MSKTETRTQRLGLGLYVALLTGVGVCYKSIKAVF